MLFWSLALAVTAIACAALYYAAAGRGGDATANTLDTPEMAHLRLQLREIDADLGLGRLGIAEAEAAKAEVAREVIRLRAEAAPQLVSARAWRPVVLTAITATVMLTGITYYALGSPELPAQPLAERQDVAPAGLTLDDAVARIEAQLAKSPDDVRGWTVIAPVYMQLGRFADAANALRKVIAISGSSADRDTDLGEALMMEAKGIATGEPLELFRAAAASDATHVRSRYYIASELTRAGDYAAAKRAWTDLLAMSKGDEAWVAAARDGLKMAEAEGVVPEPEPGNGVSPAIRGMVEGLSTRLFAQGGSIEDWTRLVRSRLVLDQVAEAQTAYEAARAAFPDPAQRTELDVLAADNGLVAKK